MGLIEDMQRRIEELESRLAALENRDDLPEWVPYSVAAHRWGVKENTISNYVSRGIIPAYVAQRGKVRRDYVEARYVCDDWQAAADMIGPK